VLVTYIDHMGTDLSVVNAAKVSFGKRSEWVETDCSSWDNEEDKTHYWKEYSLHEKDQRLIQFLARGCTSGDWASLKRDAIIGNDHSVFDYIRRMPSHWSPFAHTAISLHLKMPIFVARQIMKHTTGIEYNEVSRRYVDGKVEFYEPDVWRKAADNVKQGSSDEAVEFIATHPDCTYDVGQIVSHRNDSQILLYRQLLGSGVAPEQARMVLPQSMYTEVIATGNLYAWANMYNQRTDSHAQKETQDLAKQIGEIIQPLYPVSWASLVA
jgi:thymidylate synthase (FAD)